MTSEMADRSVQPESTPRHEDRFIASEELARLAMRTAGSHLQLAHDDRPYQWSTTAYCDTYDWAIFRAAEAGQALRLRFREYHRTRPDEAFTSARVWLELKEDTVDMSRKERFEIAGDVIPAFLRGETDLTDVSTALGQKASFSREFFEPGPGFLAVSCLPPIPWYDLGTPEGVARCFRNAGLHPTWLDAVAPPAVDGNSRGPKDHTPRQAEVPHGDRNDLL